MQQYYRGLIAVLLWHYCGFIAALLWFYCCRNAAAFVLHQAVFPYGRLENPGWSILCSTYEKKLSPTVKEEDSPGDSVFVFSTAEALFEKAPRALRNGNGI